MLIKILILTANNTRHNIAHAIVIANLLMLVPCSRLTSLSRPFAHLISDCLAAGKQASSGRSCDYLVAVIAHGGIVTE